MADHLATWEVLVSAISALIALAGIGISGILVGIAAGGRSNEPPGGRRA